jgi:hypothetical protein
MRIRPVLLLSCLSACTLSTSATAAVYLGTAYEPFNYGTAVDAGNTTGDGNLNLNNGGSGWNATGDSAQANTTSWAGTNSNITSGSLLGLAPSVGNSVVLNAGTNTRPLGQTVDAGSLYISYAVQRTTDSFRTINFALFNGGTEVFGFGQYATATAGTSTSGNFAGVFLNSNPTNLIPNPAPIAVGTNTAHQIILRIDFDASGVNERVRVYVDPLNLSNESLLTPYLDNSNFNLTAVTAIRPFSGAATTSGDIYAAGVGQFDEIRVGSTFAAVTVPEPGVTASLMLGLAVLGRRRQRR